MWLWLGAVKCDSLGFLGDKSLRWRLAINGQRALGGLTLWRGGSKGGDGGRVEQREKLRGDTDPIKDSVDPPPRELWGWDSPAELFQVGTKGTGL